jgi:RimJ/RimL family protein N-acetyltransferase
MATTATIGVEALCRTERREALMPASFCKYSVQEWSEVLEMYRTFEPKAVFQGLPPSKESVRRKWLRDLLRSPRNESFVLKHGDRVFAHAALVDYPHLPGQPEVILFVHQRRRRRGWGRRLLLAAMRYACLRCRLKRVWLTVEVDNMPARQLYRSVGFISRPPEEMWDEIEMSRSLACAVCKGTECPVHEAELIT